jgi:hypothetical protein
MLRISLRRSTTPAFRLFAIGESSNSGIGLPGEDRGPLSFPKSDLLTHYVLFAGDIIGVPTDTSRSRKTRSPLSYILLYRIRITNNFFSHHHHHHHYSSMMPFLSISGNSLINYDLLRWIVFNAMLQPSADYLGWLSYPLHPDIREDCQFYFLRQDAGSPRHFRKPIGPRPCGLRST